jgi:hypothetical protein
VPPSDIEEVIDDAEDDDSREGAICESVRCKLGLSEHTAKSGHDTLTFSRGNRCKNLPVSTTWASIMISLLPPPEVAATISCLKAKGRKAMIHKRYTRALTKPIISGLHTLSQHNYCYFGVKITDSSMGCFFDISFPFRPTRMNASPVHLMMAYDDENAKPLKAIDANTGAPSLLHVLESTPRLAAEQANSDHVSVLLSCPVIVVYETESIGRVHRLSVFPNDCLKILLHRAFGKGVNLHMLRSTPELISARSEADVKLICVTDVCHCLTVFLYVLASDCFSGALSPVSRLVSSQSSLVNRCSLCVL